MGAWTRSRRVDRAGSAVLAAIAAVAVLCPTVADAQAPQQQWRTPASAEDLITENNASAQTPDLHVELIAPLENPPRKGAKIVVVGGITRYIPEPFRFIMQNAEVLTSQQ